LPTKAKITFLSHEHGGRKTPVNLSYQESSGNCGYCPHLVVQLPTIREHNKSDHYLGVRLISEKEIIPGMPIDLDMELMYPGIDYSALVPGATFTIREGPKIIGFGIVT
jgi:translation elongation factor EF-Tu-like GTPase